MKFIANHFYIFLSIFFSVSSQLIIKWKMSNISLENHNGIFQKFTFAFTMLFNPFIILSIILTLLSGLSWMIAMTKFDINYAYPFTTLGFVLIFIFSIIIFHESYDSYKIIGLIFIILGIIITSRSL